MMTMERLNERVVMTYALTCPDFPVKEESTILELMIMI